jgi:hypothetical protein
VQLIRIKKTYEEFYNPTGDIVWQNIFLKREIFPAMGKKAFVEIISRLPFVSANC